jgi:hypothetical protein
VQPDPRAGLSPSDFHEIFFLYLVLNAGVGLNKWRALFLIKKRLIKERLIQNCLLAQATNI